MPLFLLYTQWVLSPSSVSAADLARLAAAGYNLNRASITYGLPTARQIAGTMGEHLETVGDYVLPKLDAAHTNPMIAAVDANAIPGWSKISPRDRHAIIANLVVGQQPVLDDVAARLGNLIVPKPLPRAEAIAAYKSYVQGGSYVVAVGRFGDDDVDPDAFFHFLLDAGLLIGGALVVTALATPAIVAAGGVTIFGGGAAVAGGATAAGIADAAATGGATAAAAGGPSLLDKLFGGGPDSLNAPPKDAGSPFGANATPYYIVAVLLVLGAIAALFWRRKTVGP